MAAFVSVTWTTGDILTEVKLDNMNSNIQSEDAHAANGMIMNNTIWYKGKNAAGTAQNLMRMNASDKIEIGKGEMAWERLGDTTLGSTGNVITVSGFTARKFLHILMFLNPSGGNIDGNITFNNDTGARYARRIAINGATDVTNFSQASIAAFASSAEDAFGSYEILNVATEEKILSGMGTLRGTTGAANIPNKRVLVGKWANTSDSIVRVDLTNTEAGSYDTGSKVIVLGHD